MRARAAVVIALLTSAALLSGCETAPSSRVYHLESPGTPGTTAAAAVPPPLGAAAGPLGSSIGRLRLGAKAAEVRALLGPATIESITHGQGGPQWEYDNGTIVRFGTDAGTVWQIIVRAANAGRTAENFGIGDSREAFASAYRSFSLSPGVPDDQVQVNTGGFGAGGRTLNVVFIAGRASTISLHASLAQ